MPHRWLRDAPIELPDNDLLNDAQSQDNQPDENVPTDDVVNLCAAGNPAVDIVVPLKRLDGSLFYISVQVKHTRIGNTKLALKLVRKTEEGFRMKLGRMRACTFEQLPDDVYLVFVTNRDTSGVEAADLPPRTAVLTTEVFLGSIFARIIDLERASHNMTVLCLVAKWLTPFADGRRGGQA